MRKYVKVRLILIAIFLTLAISWQNVYADATKKPVIGISADQSNYKEWPDFTFVQVSSCYVNSVIKAGGIPVVIPITTDEEVVAEQVKLLDGIILTGGEDINPLLYKEEPNITVKEVLPIRDTFDGLLLKHAIANKIPVFGTCRGQQFINVFFGGTLYQDIPTMANSYIKHNQGGNWKIGTHTIYIKKGSWLDSVLGKDEIIVNSFHHQAVKSLAPGFKITALSKDGIVEGIERESGSFCVAVQFHPEMMQEISPLMVELFKAFVQKCK